MGTSGSYSGSGGAIGDAIRDGLGDWIESLPPGAGHSGPPADGAPDDGPAPDPPAHLKLDPKVLLPILGLLRRRTSGGGSGDGPTGGGGGGGVGGGRRGGGPARTAAGSARTAARAAAAAYAYRAGDAETLDRLGLSFAELTAIGDPFEITRRIVDAACGPHGGSTIEDHEQRLVAADVAEWVLTQDVNGRPPTPEEIVRHTIALIIADVVLSETGEIINNSDHAGLAEQEIRDAAEALAAREDLSADGVSETEFAQAIERGIETLRSIVERSD